MILSTLGTKIAQFSNFYTSLLSLKVGAEAAWLLFSKVSWNKRTKALAAANGFASPPPMRTRCFCCCLAKNDRRQSLREANPARVELWPTLGEVLGRQQGQTPIFR
jgi:hypothetical protein